MVETKALTQALQKVKESTFHIKFNQTYDLIITLKDLDLKKPDQQVDIFVTLPHSKGKINKVCGLVGSELIDESKRELDMTLSDGEFQQFTASKAKLKALANEYDFFIAQANVMPKVAQFFGRALGPRGKMPNPKAGCVVPPKAQLAPIKKRLERTLRVSAKTSPNIQVPVGAQDMDAQQVIENIKEVYAQVLANLPQGVNNIKRVYLKLTMSATERVM